ncbi:MAG: glycosyltransferase family 2 protein [Pseudomonadota bacterium]
MRNEAPYVVEWVVYHRMIGFTDILLFTNDCTDGTDAIAERLAALGQVRHLPNPVAGEVRPLRQALERARAMPLVAEADWVMALDADEFLNIHAGAGRIEDLLEAAPSVDLFLINWRHLADPDAVNWQPGLVTERFVRAGPMRTPVSAAVKSLFREPTRYGRFSAHMPWDPAEPGGIRVANGSGRPIEGVFEKPLNRAYRLTGPDAGLRLAQVNHYATKSLEAYVLKKMRGSGNNKPHRFDRAYWQKRNEVDREDRTIQRHLPALRAACAALLADPALADLQRQGEAAHRAMIAEARAAGQVSLEALDALTDDRALARQAERSLGRRLGRLLGRGARAGGRLT